LWVESFDDYGWEAREIRDLGEVILALAETTGRAKASGAAFRQEQGIVALDFREGNVGQVRFLRAGSRPSKAWGWRSSSRPRQLDGRATRRLLGTYLCGVSPRTPASSPEQGSCSSLRTRLQPGSPVALPDGEGVAPTRVAGAFRRARQDFD
jgi:hypothetical protein